MKKISRRNFMKATGLSTIPAALMLSGCGDSTSTSTGTGTTAGSSASTDDAPTDGRIGNGTDSFKFWLAIHALTAEAYNDHNDHPAALRLEEATGMVVDYLNPAVGQDKEQMNLLLGAMTDLPDLMKFNLTDNYKGGVDGCINDGVIIDATKIIEENAPNFMAMINSDESVRRDTYTDSGVIRMFGSCIPGEEMRGLPFQGPMINKTLLDKTGLDIPETIAEWEEVLEAFKGLGVVPFSFGCDKTFTPVANYGAFCGAFGVPMGSTFFQVDGEVKYGPIEPGYRDFLETFAKWYSNGWLDPDFLTKNQNKDVRPDFDGGRIGAALLHINSVASAPVTSVKQGNEEAIAIPVPYPVLNKGETPHFRHHVANYNMDPTYITTVAKNPEQIVKWVDYLYSPEGITECSFGVKDDPRFDDTYYITEDGTKDFTDFIKHHPDGLTESQCFRRYMFRDGMCVWDWECQSLMYTDPRQQEGWSVWGAADFAYELPSALTYTADEAEEISKLMSDAKNYVEQMAAKFIMGIESFDNYDAYLSTLTDRMKIGKVIEIQQAAMTRYLAR